MKPFLIFLTIAAAIHFSKAASFTNSVSVDAFVRSNAPTSNYGAAGSLTVSGSTATNVSYVVNGIADTFIRFNTAALVANFNSLFGSNNWVINRAVLRVTEVGAPANTIFTRGKGKFAVSWISNDDWTEGTGMPMGPTMDGIVYTNEPTLLTNTAGLGTFTNTAINNTNFYSFALPPAFVNDISAGGEVGLYLTAIDSGIGFTFNSVNFGTTSQRPFLIISAVPQPGIAGVNLSGTDVVIAATNGAAGGTYMVLASPDISLPVGQWTPVATNVLSNALDANGDFSITATNADGIGAPAQQFFILHTQ